MPFDITQFIEFDSKGRAQCPACLADGKKAKNLSVVLGGEHKGAYKCFRGCTPEMIKSALGYQPDRLPAAIANPTPAPKATTIPPAKVREAQDSLLKSAPAIAWLMGRGITQEMIQHYHLGLARAKVGDSSKPSQSTYLPAITIPLPANPDNTAYYQKKRVAPWLPEAELPDGYKRWSQFGIPVRVWFTHRPANATRTWLVEGEWDAILTGWQLRDRQDIAVATFTSGAGNVPPDSELEKLPGQVITWYDLDDKGAQGAAKVQERLKDRAHRATVPAPSDHKPGYDLSDFWNAQGTLQELLAAEKQAIPYTPPQKHNPLRDRLIWNDDLLAHAPDYTEWLVPDLLTANELFLLASGPRMGKSLMSMTLAKAVASGGEFLGRPVSQGTVIYVCLEDGEGKIKEREVAQGWAEGLPVAWLRKFKLSELPHLREIAEELDPRLIILDTLSRIRDDDADESSAKMSQILEPLQEMASDLDCCILLVHHTGKNNADKALDINWFDTIRGSSAIRNTCRGSMVLAPSDQCYRLLVENGWGRHDLKVVLDANTWSWKLLGNWNPGLIDNNQRSQILDAIRQMGVVTVDMLYDKLKFPKKSIYKVLERLQSSPIAEEKVIKEGKRRNYTYRLALFDTIRQLEALSNSVNSEPDSDTGYIQQNIFLGEDGDESMHSIAYFSDHPPTPAPGDLSNSGLEPSQGNGFATPPSTQPVEYKSGDRVIPLAVGYWCRAGSDRVPPDVFREMRPSLKSAKEIRLSEFPDRFFHQLQQPSVVISVSLDKGRVKVRNPEGRTSVFTARSLRRFEEATHAPSS